MAKISYVWSSLCRVTGAAWNCRRLRVQIQQHVSYNKESQCRHQTVQIIKAHKNRMCIVMIHVTVWKIVLITSIKQKAMSTWYKKDKRLDSNCLPRLWIFLNRWPCDYSLFANQTHTHTHLSLRYLCMTSTLTSCMVRQQSCLHIQPLTITTTLKGTSITV